MHKLKELYSSPLSELLVVRFEEDVLTGSPDGTWDNSISPGTDWGSDDDYGLE